MQDINWWLYGLLPAFVGVVPYLVERWHIGAAVAEALDEAGVNRKDAADAMGITVAQLSRALSGCGPDHLSAQRLTRLPNRVWWRLLPKLATLCGVSFPDSDQRARHMAQVAVRTVRAGARRETREAVHEMA